MGRRARARAKRAATDPALAEDLDQQAHAKFDDDLSKPAKTVENLHVIGQWGMGLLNGLSGKSHHNVYQGTCDEKARLARRKRRFAGRATKQAQRRRHA